MRPKMVDPTRHEPSLQDAIGFRCAALRERCGDATARLDRLNSVEPNPATALPGLLFFSPFVQAFDPFLAHGLCQLS